MADEVLQISWPNSKASGTVSSSKDAMSRRTIKTSHPGSEVS
jgi:hypothetical protein